MKRTCGNLRSPSLVSARVLLHPYSSCTFPVCSRVDRWIVRGEARDRDSLALVRNATWDDDRESCPMK